MSKLNFLTEMEVMSILLKTDFLSDMILLPTTLGGFSTDGWYFSSFFSFDPKLDFLMVREYRSSEV